MDGKSISQCGTSGGVVVMFDKIEVVNQLQYDHVWDTVKEYSAEYDSLWIFEKVHMD
jgi:erlin